MENKTLIGKYGEFSWIVGRGGDETEYNVSGIIVDKILEDNTHYYLVELNDGTGFELIKPRFLVYISPD